MRRPRGLLGGSRHPSSRRLPTLKLPPSRATRFPPRCGVHVSAATAVLPKSASPPPFQAWKLSEPSAVEPCPTCRTGGLWDSTTPEASQGAAPPAGLDPVDRRGATRLLSLRPSQQDSLAFKGRLLPSLWIHTRPGDLHGSPNFFLLLVFPSAISSLSQSPRVSVRATGRSGVTRTHVTR